MNNFHFKLFNFYYSNFFVKHANQYFEQGVAFSFVIYCSYIKGSSSSFFLLLYLLTPFPPTPILPTLTLLLTPILPTLKKLTTTEINYKNCNITLNHQLVITMVDGKVTQILTDTSSAQTCVFAELHLRS